MKKALVVLFVTVVLIGLYMFAGGSTPATSVHYHLDISEGDTPWMEVNMTVYPGRGGFLDLFMRDTVLLGDARVRGFAVLKGGRERPSWNLIPGQSDIRRLWAGFSSQPLEISYLVNPLWLRGSSPRSYLGPEFGYLRGMNTFFAPFTWSDIREMLRNNDNLGPHAGTATLTATLPAGWSMSSPWSDGDDIEVPALRNTYLGVGPFSHADVDSLRIAVYENGELPTDALLELLPEVFKHLVELFGAEPVGSSPIWTVTVLPDDPLRGGAAGVNSLIGTQEPSLLAHEMIHWWLGRSIQFSPDAHWIEEGFTTYYEGRVLRDVGVWTEEQFQSHLNRQLQRLPRETVDLLQASVRLLRDYTPRDYGVVYGGGALVANFIDKELTAQGASLDDVWSYLPRDETVTPEMFLEALSDMGYADLADQSRAFANGHEPIPH